MKAQIRTIRRPRYITAHIVVKMYIVLQPQRAVHPLRNPVDHIRLGETVLPLTPSHWKSSSRHQHPIHGL